MKLIYLVVFLLAFTAKAEDEALDGFKETINKEYSLLLEYIAPSERLNWNERKYEITKIITEEHHSHEEMVEYFKRQGSYESYKDILPFSYLKKVRFISLDMQTDLTNELGRNIYHHYYDAEIRVLLLAIESELTGLQNKQGALQLQSQLTKYFNLKRKIEELSNNPQILSEFEYRPRSNAWDSTPILMKKFVLYDWVKSIKALGVYKEELENIKDSFISFNTLKLQDPTAYISFGSQIAVLLITVAGYIISYTDKPSLRVISLLVISSMGVSLLMITISSSTLLNIAIQALLPGAFIIYWTAKRYRKGRSLNILSSKTEQSD